MDEPVLIQRAQRGDTHAFNSLVLHHQTAVYNFAYRLLGDPAAAADAAQEAFIAPYQALNQIRDGSFRAWLLHIARNKCYDALRKEQRHPEPSLDELTEEKESPSFMGSDAASPEEQSEQAELLTAIESCLAQLPIEQREAVVLRDIQDYDYAEIAQILSISLGTVKSRLSRARLKLQGCLQGVWELLPSRYRFMGSIETG